MKTNFCPAPWMSMFVHDNTTGMCCVDREKSKSTPEEFLNSKELQNTKIEFLAGKSPTRCNTCWNWERQGLQSIRQYYTRLYPECTAGIDIDTKLPVKHMELRASNLCNLSCRMCSADNSIEIEREIEKNSYLKKWFLNNTVDQKINNTNWQQVLEHVNTLKILVLTGGEPMLIKEYYDLLDLCVANGKNKDISLIIYTNGSVYNPKFIEKISQFDTVKINVSIDAVGKTAEYQRYGIGWGTVKQNTIQFAKLDIKLGIHSTVTAYSLLDFSALADFYKELLALDDTIEFKAHVATGPKPLTYLNLTGELANRAKNEIKKSLLELDAPAFAQITAQLKNILFTLGKNNKNNDDFVNMTRDLDLSRNQSFESVFGYKLY